MSLAPGQFRGCVVGHALGDALGAPVEFMSRADILRGFGPDGIRRLEPWDGHPRGSYTDDTQMMRATAEGVLDALKEWRDERFAIVGELVYERYIAWCATQDDPSQDRRPGETCLTALRSGQAGDTFDPINDRKGSGGIMRVSPVGLAFEPQAAFETGVELAALTHGHPSGYLAAGVYADILSRVIRGAAMFEAVADSREQLISWGDDADETLASLDHAVELFVSDVHPVEATVLLGQGWVAEEALGIAVYCALSYPEDWVEGTLAAVNITGDSDTTGCLAGALLGASLGEEALPEAWIAQLEDAEDLVNLADRLWRMVGATE